MAHYAFLDKDNIVTEVIVGRNENEVIDGISDWEAYYGDFRGQKCVRTSYNNNIRKNYAGIGYTYDEALDAFIPPKPTDFPSFIVDPETGLWTTPIPRPDGDEPWGWNESTQEWVIMDIPALDNESLPPPTGEY
jgi:hypothetical protein